MLYRITSPLGDQAMVPMLILSFRISGRAPSSTAAFARSTMPVLKRTNAMELLSGDQDGASCGFSLFSSMVRTGVPLSIGEIQIASVFLRNAPCLEYAIRWPSGENIGL